jgi:hypothetical protein
VTDIVSWLVAVVACALPRRVWPRVERTLPLRLAAPAGGLVTCGAGCAIGIVGFFTFASQLADANNTWMLNMLSKAPTSADHAVGLVPYGMSVITLFLFLFFTPAGLLSIYLTGSGFVRSVAAWFDEPIGDPILTGIHAATTRLVSKHRAKSSRAAREELEGAEVPDALYAGDWAGLDVDYVLVASRRKPEWHAGAIVMTSEEWYKLGVPFDKQTSGGLRTVYPLKKMETVEVVRRGIQYELPQLRKSGPKSQSATKPRRHEEKA